MNSQDINGNSIREYLGNIGIVPMKVHDGYGMYLSPLRHEQTPSFKVDFRKNLWFDFGASEGGALVDLVMKINSCSFYDAVKKLESEHHLETSFSFQESVKSSSLELIDVIPLTNQKLLYYLLQRAVSVDLAKRICKEVHYSISGKSYFAVGFENDSGGYELRNPYFKGCIAPKNATGFDNGKNECFVFEGFVDYLSYLTFYRKIPEEQNALILNSVVNIERASNFLKEQIQINCYMDNDAAGRNAVLKIAQINPHVLDHSGSYPSFKDLNEFVCHTAPTNPKTHDYPRIKM